MHILNIKYKNLQKQKTDNWRGGA